MTIPDPRLQKGYDPNARRLYKVGKVVNNAKKRLVITEIRRPEPAACLLLEEGATVSLSNDEIRILINLDAGPLIPRDLLTDLGPDTGKPLSEKPAAEKPAGDPATDPAAGAKPKADAKK